MDIHACIPTAESVPTTPWGRTHFHRHARLSGGIRSSVFPYSEDLKGGIMARDAKFNQGSPRAIAGVEYQATAWGPNHSITHTYVCMYNY